MVPSAVDAQFILQTSSGTTGATVAVPQKFVTKYKLSGQTSEVFYRSGNPGYLDLELLLVGTVDATSGGITSPKDGFLMPVSSSTCLTTTDSANFFSTSVDNALRFGQNFTTSCYLQATANTEAAFNTLCNAPNLSSLAIFNQLASMTRIGRYGNANVNYPSDWVTVIEQDLNYGTTTYDTTTKSCTLITEVDVQILTADVGFPDNQHSYVVTARKKGKARTIYYDDFLSNQRIDIKVEFEYIRVTEDEASLSAYVSLSNFNWPADILWPFMTLDSAFGFTSVSVCLFCLSYTFLDLIGAF